MDKKSHPLNHFLKYFFFNVLQLNYKSLAPYNFTSVFMKHECLKLDEYCSQKLYYNQKYAFTFSREMVVNSR